MKNLILLIIAALYVAGCGPTTQITASWKNPDEQLTGSVNTIFVTALTGRPAIRQNIENDIAAVLEKKGYNTVKSMDVLPPTFSAEQTPNRDTLLTHISATRADVILTVALIDEKTETRYVPGAYGYAPIPRFDYYGTFWRYYTNWYPTLNSPGYYEENKVYFLETNLYDAKTEELLWSAQSESYNPVSLPEFSDEFAKVVISKLEDDRILTTGNTELATERDTDNR